MCVDTVNRVFVIALWPYYDDDSLWFNSTLTSCAESGDRLLFGESDIRSRLTITCTP